MSELLLTLGGFVVMGLCCIWLERVWPENPQQQAWRLDSWIDVTYLALRIALSILLVGITLMVGGSLPERTPYLAGRLPFGLQLILVALLLDFFSYWVHRLHHHVDVLWGMHAIHHDPRQIDWLVAARVHPVELVIGKLTSVFPVYALGFTPDVFGVVLPLMATYSLLLHANLTWDYGVFGYFLASPAFHRWHHSSEEPARDKNFAQFFAGYDYLFGTAYFPHGRHSSRYGVSGSELVPQRFLGQMLFPIVRLLPTSNVPERKLISTAGAERLVVPVAEKQEDSAQPS
jgi:sterol desaturase/sphingolipid hydroxylase (fatty acid hydroxylase superfamily)